MPTPNENGSQLQMRIIIIWNFWRPRACAKVTFLSQVARAHYSALPTNLSSLFSIEGLNKLWQVLRQSAVPMRFKISCRRRLYSARAILSSLFLNFAENKSDVSGLI